MTEPDLPRSPDAQRLIDELTLALRDLEKIYNDRLSSRDNGPLGHAEGRGIRYAEQFIRGYLQDKVKEFRHVNWTA